MGFLPKNILTLSGTKLIIVGIAITAVASCFISAYIEISHTEDMAKKAESAHLRGY
jgi:hypothetical protein